MPSRAPLFACLAVLVAVCVPAAPAVARTKGDSERAAPSLTPALARAAARSGQWESAARLWRLRTQAEPEDAEAWAGLGEALTRTGLAGDAVAALARAAELSPGLPGLALFLGRAQLQQGNAGAALAAFGAAAEATPRNPAAWTGLGIAHDLLGEHAAAQSAYGRALALDPLNQPARHNLALSRTLVAGSRPGGVP